jgi:hypothetical protein
MGSALNNTARQVGAALGVALVSAMLVAASKASDPLQGFHNSWHLTAGIIFASGIAMLVLFRRPTEAQLAAAV